jgi:hypothetical protein
VKVPGFTAEAALRETNGRYRGARTVSSSAARVVPAIPLCSNCDFVCDVCLSRGLACGACRYCSIGFCDPRGPGEL